ncbi:MAG: tyrosine--tRNA ligase [Candidatus Paceibacterota bacterium]
MGKTNKTGAQIDRLLSRAVENIYPNPEALKDKLAAEGKLTVYAGIDPTGPSLHLGHGSIILKLKEFLDLGQRVILLIGDFTATIGDPTDKLSVRHKLSPAEVKVNYKKYRQQLAKLIDLSKVEIVYNRRWFAKMKLEQVLALAGEFTVGQMIERDMFKQRIKNNKPIYLNEFLYPLMQGFDSVMLDADVEVGGNDQTFNMLAGRTLQKKYGREKMVVSLKLLTDSLGKKMGKTENNAVFLSDQPNDMYGKIMSWSDDLIRPAFEICTSLDKQIIDSYLALGPRDAKMKLAKSIVALYKGDKAAETAEADFVGKFQQNKIPTDLPVIKVAADSFLSDVLLTENIIKSKTEFRRLIDSGAIRVNGQKINDSHYQVKSGGTVKVGKTRFIKLEMKN